MASLQLSKPSTGNVTALAEYYSYHAAPSKYDAGLVVLSLIVAYLGAWTALLILGKRTSNRGPRNIALLVLAAVVLAAVGIWSLHIIATYSLSFSPASGIEWHIGLNPTFTAISILVPTATLILSFFFIDSVAFRLWRTLVSGIFTGVTIALLHYSASLSLPAWSVSYEPARLVVSVVLAIVVSCVALTLFFRFRSHWDDSWWKRGLCAFLLGSAVSAMHWTGQAASSYKVRPSVVAAPARLNNHNDRRALLAATVFSCVCLIVAAAISVHDLFAARKTRENARKVVVCSATFDKQGHLLVKDDGTLPMVVIETPLRHSEVLEAIDKRQTTFQWLYSISWDWNIVVDFLKAMSLRFFLLENAEESPSQGLPYIDRVSILQKRSHKRVTRTLGKPSMESSCRRQKLADFRDRFIDAAGQLAVQLDFPFQRIGVLYDQVMPTGTYRATKLAAKAAGISFHNSSKDGDEVGSAYGRPTPIFGDGEECQEGAMLFLVREMSQDTTRESEERYLQRGYRLTDTRFLGAHLARLYAVPKKDMDFWLSNLKMYAKRGTRPVVQPGGVYAGLFGVRASMTRFGGLETLVYGFARHQIPAYRLPRIERITPQIRHFVRCLDRTTLEEAQAACRREATLALERIKPLSAVRSSRQQSRSCADANEEQDIEKETDVLDHISSFQMSLCVALDALQNSVRFYPKLGSSARLSADILEVPSSLDDSTAPAEMILVQAVLPDDRAVFQSSQIDASQVIPTDQPQPDTPFVFTPYTLFAKSQMMLLKGRQADLFEQQVLWELKSRYPEVNPAHAFKMGLKEDADGGLEKGESSTVCSNDGLVSSQMATVGVLEHSGDGQPASPRGLTASLFSLVPDHMKRASLAIFKRDPLPTNVEMHTTGSSKSVSNSPTLDCSGIRSSSLTLPNQSSMDRTTIQRFNGNDRSHSPVALLFSSPVSMFPTRPFRSSTGFSSTATTLASTPATAVGFALSASQSHGIRRFLQQSTSDEVDSAYPTSSLDGTVLRPRGDSITSNKIGSLTRDDAATGTDGSVPHMNSSFRGTANVATATECAPAILSNGLRQLAANLASSTVRPISRPSLRRPSTAQPTSSTPFPGGNSFAPPAASGQPANAVCAIKRICPRAADVESRPVGLSLSQRRMTLSGSRANPRSITARTSSDDWMNRHLLAIERGPAGHGLLGVDY